MDNTSKFKITVKAVRKENLTTTTKCEENK